MAHQLDEVDIKILAILQKDARLTNKEIGNLVNKSATPVGERIRRMEHMGLIRKYVAVLDPIQINRSLMTITHIQLKDHSEDSLEAFESAIIQFDEVLECYHISGAYDFTLKIAVKGLSQYHHFLMKKLFKLAPIASVQSTFVMKEAKTGTAYTLDQELLGGARV